MFRYEDKFRFLLDRYLDYELVYKYFYIDEGYISRVVDSLFEDIIKKIKIEDKSKCIVIGGQPGSGKSWLCHNYLDNNGNYAYVNLDNYRIYHPYFNDIKVIILDSWGLDNGNSEDNPSLDLSMFTHYFAVRVNDLLLKKLSDRGYNILLEWNLRYFEGPLMFLTDLHNKGYFNEVILMITDRRTSYEACILRYESIYLEDRLGRRISRQFHDLCIEGFINSIKKLRDIGFIRDKVIDSIWGVLRDGTIIWKNNDDLEIVNKYLNDVKFIKDNNSEYAKIIYLDENNRLF